MPITNTPIHPEWARINTAFRERIALQHLDEGIYDEQFFRTSTVGPAIPRPSAILRAALTYAGRGLRVLALSPLSKVPPSDPPGTPKGKGGVHLASTDPEEVSRLFAHVGEGANVGLVPGPRFWVLDVDTEPPKAHPEGMTGHEAIEALSREYGPLPKTAACATPRGGLHLWWVAGDGAVIRPRGSGTLVLGKWAGLDVRSIASYVVAPPSLVKVDRGDLVGQVKSYRWTSLAPPVVPPAWLVQLLITEVRTGPVDAPLPYSGPAGNGWARAVLASSCRECGDPNPGRHDRWFRMALLVGGYIGGGHLERHEAEVALVSAAHGSVAVEERRDREIRRTIAQGIEDGIRKPCHPPERGAH